MAKSTSNRWVGRPVKKDYSTMGFSYRQDRVEDELAAAERAIKRGAAVIVRSVDGREIYRSHEQSRLAKREEQVVVKGVLPEHFNDSRFAERLDKAKETFHWHGGMDPENAPEKEAPKWRSKNADIFGDEELPEGGLADKDAEPDDPPTSFVGFGK